MEQFDSEANSRRAMKRWILALIKDWHFWIFAGVAPAFIPLTMSWLLREFTTLSRRVSLRAAVGQRPVRPRWTFDTTNRHGPGLTPTFHGSERRAAEAPLFYRQAPHAPSRTAKSKASMTSLSSASRHWLSGVTGPQLPSKNARSKAAVAPLPSTSVGQAPQGSPCIHNSMLSAPSTPSLPPAEGS